MYRYLLEYSKNFLSQYIYDFPEQKFSPEGTNIIYNLNIDGFRSANFYTLIKNRYNILYAGCSNTYGSGLPVHHTWPYMLSKEIKNYKDNVDYFNIGYIGASTHSIIRNINAFIENYGSPNIIFMLLPSPGRDLYFSKKYDRFTNSIISDYFASSNIESQRNFNLTYVEENSVLLATTLIFSLELLCKKANIKLIWSTWDEDTNNLYKKINFDFFLPMDKVYVSKIENTNRIRYWNYAADKEHPGVMWSQLVVNENIGEFLKRGYDK